MGVTANFCMNNFQFVNNNMNQNNNFNGFNNPIFNQYNQMNPMLNQMYTYYQGNPMMNKMGNFKRSNSMYQMNNYNQGNPILNQMGNYNQNNQMQNQMNQMMFQNMNQMMNQMNQMMNQMNPNVNQMNQNVNQMNQNKNQMYQNMNQMNQMNKINQNERKKEMIQNTNLNNLNENQMDLINSIIKFYKENDNEFMDFDYPNQISKILDLLSINYSKLDKSDNIEDPLYYIGEPKKIIRFINSDYKEYKVNIPLSITKYDLYSIAQNYKCFKNNKKHLSGNHSNILLINNNIILNRDKTSIECINNNDIVIIIEPRNFPDDSYYNSLQERTGDKGCIEFNFSSGKSSIYRMFPEDIKISEIYKSINLELGLDINTYKLIYSGGPLEKNDQQEATFLLYFAITILEYNIFTKKIIFGNIVIANIKGIGQEPIGLLNSINDLKELILNYIGKKIIKTLIIENNLIEEGDFRSLLSLGIRSDFECFVDYEK